jgi:hypothetical protein
MASKKAPASPPVDVPSVLSADDESNKLVARTKGALAKKWSLTRSETLAEAAHVAWFLVALGRDDEARALADHIGERVTFTGDRNLWAAAATSIALSARLARLGGDDARRATLVARLVVNPAVAIAPREALVKSVAEADKDVRSAEVDPSQKFACQGFARGCARASYFLETAAEGAYEAGALDVDALERTIEQGLAGLRAHLGR